MHSPIEVLRLWKVLESLPLLGTPKPRDFYRQMCRLEMEKDRVIKRLRHNIDLDIEMQSLI